MPSSFRRVIVQSEKADVLYVGREMDEAQDVALESHHHRIHIWQKMDGQVVIDVQDMAAHKDILHQVLT